MDVKKWTVEKLKQEIEIFDIIIDKIEGKPTQYTILFTFRHISFTIVLEDMYENLKIPLSLLHGFYDNKLGEFLESKTEKCPICGQKFKHLHDCFGIDEIITEMERNNLNEIISKINRIEEIPTENMETFYRALYTMSPNFIHAILEKVGEKE